MIQPRKKSSDGGAALPNPRPAQSAALSAADPLLQPLLQARPGALQRTNSGTQRPKSTGKRAAVSPAIDLRRGATLASAALTQVCRPCGVWGVNMMRLPS